jgi:hypothetical protein
MTRVAPDVAQMKRDQVGDVTMVFDDQNATLHRPARTQFSYPAAIHNSQVSRIYHELCRSGSRGAVFGLAFNVK